MTAMLPEIAELKFENDIKLSTNIYGGLLVTNHSGAVVYKDVYGNSALFAGFVGRSLTVDTPFKVWKTGAGANYVEVAKMHTGAVPYFEISKAYHIYPATDNGAHLGHSGARFNTAYIDHIICGSVAREGEGLSTYHGKMRLPAFRGAGILTNHCRYDAATNTFEIYDGAAWQPH